MKTLLLAVTVVLDVILERKPGAAAAEAAGCDGIVSRDAAGFPDAALPVMDPAAALAWLRG